MFANYLSATATDYLFFALALILFVGGIYLLVRLQRNHVKFGTRVFGGLGLGVLLGLIFQLAFAGQANALKLTLSWVNLVSGVYVGLLKMIVIPLVMVSVITAIVKLQGQRNVGKIGGSVLAVLLTTTAIAALVGALTTHAFGLTTAGLEQGEAEKAQAAALQQNVTKVQTDLPSQIVSFIPANPFLDMTGQRSTSTIATVIFSGFVGFGILSVGKRRKDLYDKAAKGLEVAHDVVLEIVKVVLRLTPFGVLALMTNIVAGSNWAQILKLANFVLLSYVAILIMYLIHLGILAGFGLNPITYLRKVWSTLSFAFVSRSSAATLPMTIKTQTSTMGVPESIANLGSSFAVTIGQNGCAGIYPAMLAVMVAPTLGINPLAPAFLLKLILVVAIGSFGIAGVGGGATYAGLVVLSSMGLPVWIAALLIAVEPLIDMARTSLNVSGAFVADLVTARLRGELDVAQYNSPTPALDEEGVPTQDAGSEPQRVPQTEGAASR